MHVNGLTGHATSTQGLRLIDVEHAGSIAFRTTNPPLAFASQEK